MKVVSLRFETWKMSAAIHPERVQRMGKHTIMPCANAPGCAKSLMRLLHCVPSPGNLPISESEMVPMYFSFRTPPFGVPLCPAGGQLAAGLSLCYPNPSPAGTIDCPTHLRAAILIPSCSKRLPRGWHPAAPPRSALGGREHGTDYRDSSIMFIKSPL